MNGLDKFIWIYFFLILLWCCLGEGKAHNEWKMNLRKGSGPPLERPPCLLPVYPESLEFFLRNSFAQDPTRDFSSHGKLVDTECRFIVRHEVLFHKKTDKTMELPDKDPITQQMHEIDDPDTLKKMTDLCIETFPSCRAQALDVLACQTNPRYLADSVDIAAICRPFHVKLKWCVLTTICPQEAKEVEECFGEVPGVKIMRTPWKCRRKYKKFEKCMDSRAFEVEGDLFERRREEQRREEEAKAKKIREAMNLTRRIYSEQQ